MNKRATCKRMLVILVTLTMILSCLGIGGSGNTPRVINAQELATATDSEVSASATGENEGESFSYENIYNSENFDVSFKLDNKWDTGYNATITITNTSDSVIENWCLTFPLSETISNIWNATVSKTHEDFYVIKNAGWNQDIAVGGSVSFGLTVYEPFTAFPEYYTIIGNQVETKSEDYTIDYKVTEDWGDGYKAEVTITNNKDTAIEDWRLTFDYGDNLITQIWDAVVVDNTNGRYVIGCPQYNQDIPVGESVTFGFMVEPGNSDAEINNIIVSEYTNDHSDKYLTLIGYLPDSSNVLELFIESSEEYSKYEIYAVIDDENPILIDTISELKEYTYSLPCDFSQIEIYLRGYYSDYAYHNSLSLYVTNNNGKYALYMPDTDGDGLEDCVEIYYGSDIEIIDTDGDGLDDYYEVAISGTSPSDEDTDSNEILDCNEDYDEDGLCIIDEKKMSTNPWDYDTDMDELLDGDEVNIYGTDPINPDTDEDGLVDLDEIKLETDPLNPDTDADGVLDGEELFYQTYTHTVENKDCVIYEVEVSMEGTGCLESNTYIESVMGVDILCSDVEGLIGEPFEIESNSKFNNATITFKLDAEKLGDIPFGNLLFLWYDEENQQFVEMETILDKKNSTVSIETTHFSKYMIVNSADWYSAWAEEMDYNPNFDSSNAHYNTVLAIDCSGSMRDNDPITTNNNVNSQYEAMYRKQCHRIKGAEAFLNRMSGDDNTSIVLFDSSASIEVTMTNNKQDLKLALQNVSNSGGTSFDAALRTSMLQFDEDMLNDENACNRIILLSDGQSSYSKDLLREIDGKDIKIYTIGLGKNADIKTLNEISSATDGESYKADASDELEYLYERIFSTNDFDKTDSDKDLLYDYIEKVGIRLVNGRVIYTNPGNNDSDGDDLLDGEEINPDPIYFEKEFVLNGEVVFVKGYSFIMNSDPNSIDSDGDGLYDNKKRIVIDEKNKSKTVSPIDPQPLVFNGRYNIWDSQYSLELSGDRIAHYLIGNYQGKFSAEFGGFMLNFDVDDKEIAMHSNVCTWQEIFGYNNMYDVIFALGTNGNMRKEKFVFEYENKDYVVWIWKGNYLNLGSGAEIGLYKRNIVYGTWSAVNFELPMELNLYHNENGTINNLFCWHPYERQWWITGFCPEQGNFESYNLITLGCIDFSGRTGMFKAIKDQIESDSELNDYMIFDEDEYKVWIIW